MRPPAFGRADVVALAADGLRNAALNPHGLSLRHWINVRPGDPRTGHNGKHRYIGFLEHLARFAQAVAAVVIAAIGDHDDGAALVFRFPLCRANSRVEAVEESGAAVRGLNELGQAMLQAFLIGGEGRKTPDARFDAEK